MKWIVALFVLIVAFGCIGTPTQEVKLETKQISVFPNNTIIDLSKPLNTSPPSSIIGEDVKENSYFSIPLTIESQNKSYSDTSILLEYSKTYLDVALYKLDYTPMDKIEDEKYVFAKDMWPKTVYSALFIGKAKALPEGIKEAVTQYEISVLSKEGLVIGNVTGTIKIVR